jgi:hypothetical protein
MVGDTASDHGWQTSPCVTAPMEFAGNPCPANDWKSAPHSDEENCEDGLCAGTEPLPYKCLGASGEAAGCWVLGATVHLDLQKTGAGDAACPAGVTPSFNVFLGPY